MLQRILFFEYFIFYIILDKLYVSILSDLIFLFLLLGCLFCGESFFLFLLLFCFCKWVQKRCPIMDILLLCLLIKADKLYLFILSYCFESLSFNSSQKRFVIRSGRYLYQSIFTICLISLYTPVKC